MILKKKSADNKSMSSAAVVIGILRVAAVNKNL